MPTLGWRWLLGLSTIPLFIFAILCFVSMLAVLSCSTIWSMIDYSFINLIFLLFFGGWEQWLPESARYDVLTGNQEKALNTLKRIATENGAPMPLGKLIAARQVRCASAKTKCFVYIKYPLSYCHLCSEGFFMAVFFYFFFIRKIVGRFETYFHLTSAGPQSCCGLFGKLAIDNVFLFLENLAFSLSSDLPKANQHELICVCSCRFANAFSYYGLVLLTTELFQEGGACGSESDAEGFTHFMVVMFLQKASQTVGWVLDLKHPVWCNSL